MNRDSQHVSLFLLMLSVASLRQALPAAEISVDVDFEGASARVIEIDQAKSMVRLMPGGDPVRGWPAWWYCRIDGLLDRRQIDIQVVPSSLPIPAGHPGAGKPLSGSWALPSRAAWSANGDQWQTSAPGKRDGAGMVYRFTPGGDTLWVAWGPPATPAIANRWLNDFSEQHAFATKFELAQTREGRTVAGLRIAEGDVPLDSRRVVWLQARQHAWESGSSWVAQGVIHWLTSNEPDAVWLRNHAVVFIVPIMDVDRTATGDGGKESSPHDHNRDWSDQPFYPEVAAVQNRIKQWAEQNRMAVFVDLHNPGPRDSRAFFYVAPDEAIDEQRKARRREFLLAVSKQWNAPIDFDLRTRSTGPRYHKLWRQISGTWVTENANGRTVAGCLETPWNMPGSTTEGYGKVGASLGKGISRFLKADE